MAKNQTITETSSGNPLDEIVSRSAAMEEVKRLITQISASDITVLINGESGTGKELVARAIHLLSRRRNGPLVTINCGAIPEGIFESEIFGHEKGSFTSAEHRRKGYFETAHRGTILLDEIGEMPLQVQVKILRVLEAGTFMRVGGSEEIKVDVRLLAATNKDLENESASGRFRHDLYYRLKAVNILIPPLRERIDDIPLLVEQFAQEFAVRNGRPRPFFSPEALDLLQRQYWPGNVRELKNFIESIVALSTAQTINYRDIAGKLRPAAGSGNLPVVVTRANEDLDRELLYRTLLELRNEVTSIKMMLQSMNAAKSQEIGYRYTGAEDVEAYTLDDLEKEQIRKALQDYTGNRRLAAKALGIGERTLYRKIKRYGLPG